MTTALMFALGIAVTYFLGTKVKAALPPLEWVLDSYRPSWSVQNRVRTGEFFQFAELRHTFVRPSAPTSSAETDTREDPDLRKQVRACILLINSKLAAACTTIKTMQTTIKHFLRDKGSLSRQTR